MTDSPVRPVHAVQPIQRPHSRIWWIAGGIAAVLVLAGTGIWYVTTTHGAAKPVLPRVLLGLSKYTGPGSQAYANRIENQVRANTDGLLDAPVAAFYGNASTGEFTVAAGAPCTQDSCIAGSIQQEVQQLRADGIDARSFPPGPGGLSLVCGSPAADGNPVIRCIWVDEVAAGVVNFQRGFATSPADAAAKTRQIRVAIER
jgi:hypothetical protein